MKRGLLLGMVVVLCALRAAHAEHHMREELGERKLLAPPWSFAVISDVHTPRRGEPNPRFDRLVARLVELRPRFVVITGDLTNGTRTDRPGGLAPAVLAGWWRSLRASLQPLVDAGIPVLPVAGNHDAYKAQHRQAYFEAFRDLPALAGDLTINEAIPPVLALDAPPFSYSVDVDGVHLSLTHIVTGKLQPAVAAWLARDLAAARGARHRFVFGHVPVVSIMGEQAHGFLQQAGPIFSRGGVDAYFAGHEHLVWDQEFDVPSGGRFRQILVGTAGSGIVYPPRTPFRLLAGCHQTGNGKLCRMPVGNYGFRLARAFVQVDPATPGRMRWVQQPRQAFILVEVDDQHGFRAIPQGVDTDGRLVAFAEDPLTEAVAGR